MPEPKGFFRLVVLAKRSYSLDWKGWTLCLLRKPVRAVWIILYCEVVVSTRSITYSRSGVTGVYLGDVESLT